jgi:mRNA interferase MazF
VKRGDVWTAAGGADYAGKPRPVVVVQDDRFEATNSVTVCAFTSDPTDVPSIRPFVEPDEANGLKASSRLMVDKITTVPRGKLGRRIGRLGAADLARLDRALMVFLGLAG